MKRWIILTIGSTMILGGVIISFATSFAKDVSSTKQSAAIIEEKYQTFKELMTTINGEREILYSSVINNLYIENVESNYDEWFNTYKSYKNTIKKVTKYKSTLENHCIGIIYQNSNIQSKCESMLISYETAINYYVKDVNKLNDTLKAYNNDVKEDEQVDLFNLDSYNYIDFDDNGNYVGK